MTTDEKRGDKHEIVHVYDGIEEANHPLPGWWQLTLYGGVVFALLYFFDYQVLHAQKTPREEYEDDQIALRREAAANALSQGKVDPQVLVSMSKDPSAVGDGHAVFASTCAACHRADGGGNIGPNLTDSYWIHGTGQPGDIYTCAHDGVPAKGMPAWGPVLGDKKVAEAVAYVLTIQNTNVPNGKAPQGEKVQ
jgi:cytochrome c oxidase cbb3-type subunit 3